MKYLLPLILILISACNHNSGSNISSSGCDSITDNCKSYIDVSGDASFSFVDLGLLTVIQNSSTITVEINLLEIPESFIYNSNNISINALEYSWEVSFDVDSDGSSDNDIKLALTNFKFDGTNEAQSGILEFTQKSIWLGEGNSRFIRVGDIFASVSGTKLSLVVDRSSHTSIENINSETPIKFFTFYNTAGTTYTDSYPDDGGYAN